MRKKLNQSAFTIAELFIVIWFGIIIIGAIGLLFVLAHFIGKFW